MAFFAHAHRALYVPDTTGYFSKMKIVGTSSTHIHSFAVDQSGGLYGWGCGSDGRLGLKAFFETNGTKRLMKCYVSTPTQVEALADHQVLSVSCGKYWSFAIVQ